MSYNWEKPRSKMKMFWDNLKEKPKTQNLIIYTLICMIIFVIIQVYLFQPTEVYLRSLSDIHGLTNLGVLDLEFAWTAERIDLIFSIWNAEGISRQIIVTIIDFFYIFCYCVILIGLILLVARKLHDRFQKIEIMMILFPIMAGVFDVIENIFLLIMLGANQSLMPAFPLITSISATIKFILIYVSVGCFLTGFVGILLYHYEFLEFDD